MADFWNTPLFWIGFHLVGVALSITIYRLPAMKARSLRLPKGIMRAFTMTFYLLPPLILPLLDQPRLSWPAVVGIGAGIALLIASVVTRRLGHKALGFHPSLRQKSDLVTTGIYGWVRNPMYLSNLLLAAGWAFCFGGTHAFLCLLIWFLAYVVLIFFEEKVLAEEYGQEYAAYKTSVPYRLIPYLF